jgi:hypothetical protein
LLAPPSRRSQRARLPVAPTPRGAQAQIEARRPVARQRRASVAPLRLAARRPQQPAWRYAALSLIHPEDFPASSMRGLRTSLSHRATSGSRTALPPNGVGEEIITFPNSDRSGHQAEVAAIGVLHQQVRAASRDRIRALVVDANGRWGWHRGVDGNRQPAACAEPVRGRRWTDRCPRPLPEA